MRVLSVLSVVGLVFFSTPAQALPEKDTGNLGEVRYSVLNPTDFESLYGSGWVLMKGQSIEGSNLHTEFEITKVPDARGVFLRGKNHDRDLELGNPAGDLAIGEYQKDSVKKHDHIEGTGAGVGTPRTSYGSVTLEETVWADWGYSHHTAEHARTSGTGEDETRPRNITLNIYIKINRATNTNEAVALQSKIDLLRTRIDEIASLVESIPTRILESETFQRLIRIFAQTDTGAQSASSEASPRS